jgi:hypothetical protein
MFPKEIQDELCYKQLASRKSFSKKKGSGNTVTKLANEQKKSLTNNQNVKSRTQVLSTLFQCLATLFTNF